MVLGSIGIDQATKSSAHQHLLLWEDGQDVRQYRGMVYPLFSVTGKSSVEDELGFNLVLNLNYVRNVGAAWGAFSSWQDSLRIPFFYAITVAAVILLLYYLKTTPLGHRTARFAFVLVLSGALGNVCDRIFRGYVIDFIDVRWSIPFWGATPWRYNFPNFNWADSCICIGVFLLFFDMIFLEKLREKQRRPI